MFAYVDNNESYDMVDISKNTRIDGTFPKFKRMKYELTKSAVVSYLSARHYSVCNESEIQKKNISCEEMLVSQLVDKETARSNSILYSNASYRNAFNNDPSPLQVETYFSKFFNWVTELPEHLKCDLTKFLCPLFCHLYIDLLQGCHQQSASSLLKYYQEQNIAENELCSQVLKEFVTQDAKSRPVIKSFRSSKHKVTISPDALTILKKYLSIHGHILMLQVFQTWFDIEISSEPKEICQDMENVIPLVKEELEDNEDCQAEIQELQEAISSLHKLPPPMLMVNVYNTQHRATCGEINEGHAKTIMGFDTSEVYVWGLGTADISRSKVCANASTVLLACDRLPHSLKTPRRTDSVTPTKAVILRGHSASVQDVKIITNEVLLSVSQDKSMRAWKFSDYSCAAIYRGHNYPIWCLDVSKFGLYIATGSYDTTVRLWTLDNIFPRRVFAGHKKDVNSVHFHPNASYLASGSADKTIRMWSLADSKAVRLLLGHTGIIYTVAFSPDGQYLASAGEDKIVKIWDITAAKQLTELTGCTNVITNLTWSKDSNFLAASSLDSCIRVWNTEFVLKKTVNDTNNLDISSMYNTEQASVLNIKYDEQWLNCLTAQPTC